MKNDHTLTLTVEQAAKVLGIGRSTAYELVHTGDIPSLRLGRRIVVPRAKIAELLATCAVDDVAEFEQVQGRQEHEDLAPPANERLSSPTLF